MATIPAAASTAASAIYTGTIVPEGQTGATGSDGNNRHDDQHEQVADWIAAVHALLGALVETTDSRLSDPRTPTAHNHSGADITSGTVAVARIGTGTKTASTFYSGDGTFRVPTTATPRPSSHTLWASSSGTWTDMPAATTEIDSSVSGRLKVDMTGMVDCRIQATVRTAGVAGSNLSLQYATDGDTQATWATLSPSVTIDNIGGRTSTWGAIPTAAKADVWVRVVGAGGDGVTDPRIGLVALQVR